MLEYFDRQATSPFQEGIFRGQKPIKSSEITRVDLEIISRKLAIGEREPYVKRLRNSLRNARNHAENARKEGKEKERYRQEMRIRQHNGLLHIIGATTERLQDEDPMVDILCLLARTINTSGEGMNFETDDDPRFYIFCVRGAPQKRRLMGWHPYERREQYSNHYEDTDDEQARVRKAYHTISQFKGCEMVVLRALYLIKEVIGNDEEKIENTLKRYIKTTQTEAAGISNVAIALLEMMNNTKLIRLDEFKGLVKALAGIAIKTHGGYEILYNTYQYRVLDNRGIWESVMKEQERKNDTKRDEWGETEYSQQTNVDHLIRKREEVKRKLEKLTGYNALISTSNQSKKAREKAVLKIHIEKKVLDEEMKSLNQRIVQQIRWMVRLPQEEEKGREENIDGNYMYNAALIILEHFQDNRDLTQKMRLGKNSKYSISSEKLEQIGLFRRWLIKFQKDKKFRESIKAWAHHNPRACERWLRLHVYDIGRQCFATNQIEFLCSPKQSGDLYNRVAQTIAKLEELAEEKKPNIWKELMNAQDMMIEWEKWHYINRQTVKSIKRHLKKLQKKGFWPRSVNITMQDVITLMTIVGLGSAIGIGLDYIEGKMRIEREKKSYDVIDTGLEGRKNTVTPDIAKAAERIPSRKEASEHEPSFLGRVLHAPEWLKEGGEDNILYLRFSDKYLIPAQIDDDARVVYVKDISKAQIEAGANQLVYKVAFLTPEKEVLPPLGYKFVKIIAQENNRRIMIASDGRYAATGNIDPEKIIFIVEPQKRIGESKRIWRYEGEYGTPYTIAHFINEQRAREALETNIYRFSGDPRLKELADKYIQELYQAVIKDPEDKEEQTEIIMKYIHLYAQYVDTYRFYAFTESDVETYLAAKWMADNHNKGYPCEISAHAFEQFFGSMGVQVQNQVGVNASLINEDQLWSSTVPHVNNIVYLPNGNVLYVDMTPPVTSQTPPEDIAVQRPKKPNSFESAMQDIFPIVKKHGMEGVTAVLLLTAAAYAGNTLRKWSIRKRVENYINVSKDFSPLEHKLVSAIAVKMATQPPTPDMIDQMVHIFQRFKDYNPSEDEWLLQWLVETNAGQQVMDIEDTKKRFKAIAGMYYANTEGIRDKLPQKWQKYLVSINMESEKDQEIPYDAETVMELAQIVRKEIFDMQIRTLIIEISQKFGVESGAIEEITPTRLEEKARMIKKLLYASYQKKEMDPRTAAYLNAVHKLLSDMGTATSQPEETKTEQSKERQTAQSEK